MKNYFLRHVQVFFYALGQLARTPVASLMTISVIGITLALPCGLYLLIGNLQTVSAGWSGGAQISIFLKRNVSETKAKTLSSRIRKNPKVASVKYISSKQALEEFKQLSGFGEALDSLDHNPLPPVLVIEPRDTDKPELLKNLVDDFNQYPSVDLAQLDLEWVQRLQAMLRFIQRGILLLAALLGLAVLLTVGNTIRLAILSRRQEIEVIKLIGGTDAFIRRPFLYSGMLQGLFGAIIAWLLVQSSLLLLSGPVSELAHLYASQFQIQGPDLSISGALLGAGALLGWLGSRLAVRRHLREIEPR